MRLSVVAIALVASWTTCASAQNSVPTFYVPAVDYPSGIEVAKDEVRVELALTGAAGGPVKACDAAKKANKALFAASCKIAFERLALPNSLVAGEKFRLAFTWLGRESLTNNRSERGDPLALSPLFWLSDADYPSSAISKEEDGTVSYDAEVAPNGRVIRCSVAESSGSAILDSATCNAVTKRARYLPAVGAGGGVRQGTHRGRVRWVLP